MTERIKTVITAHDKGASKTFAGIGGKVLSLNQGLELANKAMRVYSVTLGAVISEGRQFGAQMSAVEAVTGSTAAQMAALTAEAERLGRTTAFTGVQAGQAMEELGRAGQTTAMIMETTGQALNLAAANSIELADAAGLMAVQMNIFKKEGLTAQKTADLINQTISSSPQNFEDFRYAMQYAAQTASSFNRDFAETTQIIGALAETGVRGSMAGSALSMAFARLAKPVPAAMEALKKYGITLDQINPETNKFADIIDVLNKKAVTNSDLFTILGARTAPKFFKMIAKGGDALRDFAGKQERANTALAAAEIRLDNLDGDITIFSSALSGLKLTVFKSMDRILRDIVKGSTEMVNTFSEFLENNKGTTDIVFSAIAEAMERVKDVIVFLIRSFGHLLEVIGILIGTTAFAEILEKWERLFAALKDIVDIVGPPLRKFAKLLLEKLGKAFLHFVNFVLGRVVERVELVRDVLLKIPDAIETVKSWLDAAKNGFDWFLNVMLDIGTAVNDLIKSLLKLGENALIKSVGGFTKFVKASAKALENVGKMDHALTGNSLVPSLKELSEITIKNAKRMQVFDLETSKAKKTVKDLDKEISKIKQIGGQGGVFKLIGLKDAGDFGSMLKAFGKNIKETFTESEISFGSVFSAIGSVFSKVVDSIWALFTSNEKFKAALDRIMETVGRVVAPVIEAFVPVLDALSDSIGEMAPFFKELAQDLAPLIEDLIKFATDISRAMQPIIKNIIEKLVPLIQLIVEKIGPPLIKITESLGPVIDNLLQILIPIIEELLPIVVEILGLIAELNPLIAAILEVIKEFLPIIVAVIRVVANLIRIIINVLKPIIQVLVNVLRLVAGAISALFKLLEGVFKPIFEGLKTILTTVVNVIKGLIDALKKVTIGALGGGGGGGAGGLFGIPGLGGGGGFFGFQQGTGSLTRDQLVRLPGMEPDAGLVKAHVGESIGTAQNTPAQFIFNVQAIDPKATVDELRRLLEELKASGRL